MKPERKSDYSKVPEVRSAAGQPRYALSIAVFFLMLVGYIVVFSYLPKGAPIAAHGNRYLVLMPFIATFVLQSSVRGVQSKLITTLLGFLGFFTVFGCISWWGKG